MRSDLIYPKWINAEGYLSNIVITSRIRIARNLEKYSFPAHSTKEVLKKVQAHISENIDSSHLFDDFSCYNLDELSEIDSKVLVERHLISKAFGENRFAKTVYIDSTGVSSIMLNEEDHLRIQCIDAGLELEKLYEKINSIDDNLEGFLDFAFNDNWGYLTSCPTNAGTGIRASVMLHLPAMAMSNLIQKMIPSVLQIGLTIRGIYGEGSEITGNIFQLSNQVTLGHSEQDILQKIKGITQQIVETELNARKDLKKEAKLQISDRVNRAYGILKNARLMGHLEAMELLNVLRLGIDLEILNGFPLRLINDLFVLTRPSNLQSYKGRKLNPAQRDKVRADILREKIL